MASVGAPAYDVVVVGAGIVGACCAFELARAGLSVCVVDRGGVASGTTGAGEGNILVSDKAPGPELELALLSRRLWFELIDELPGTVELEAKGGVIVTGTDGGLRSLAALSAGQRASGIEAYDVDSDRLRELEPHLAPDLLVGVHYPQDMQVQPMLATAHLLRRARDLGAVLRLRTEVLGVVTGSGGAVTAIATDRGEIACRWVVNAAGTWGGEVSSRLRAPVPVLPRRGFILVTEPLGDVVRHKVYGADYVDNVASSAEGLETSPVVESTRSGTVLVGASRERVGFDPTVRFDVLGQLAAQARALFPVLATARVQRTYRGFRPYCPDHLPVIGPDPRVDGVVHACGHEGAGIGLAPATGRLVAQALAGTPTSMPLDAFSPLRFGAAA
ncbi:MAG TPA: FAD-binding oxidoreductase [Candidatus Nanopelagicales bacterium]|nr:FAD-binding oxidoreductase [Candidatus Nanopelagicales bacterium]